MATTTAAATIPTDDPFALLDSEWASICGRRRHCRAVLARWAAQEDVFVGLRRLEDIIVEPGPTKEAYVAALFRLVRAGDELAARALLQLLVPALIRLTMKVQVDVQASTTRTFRDLAADVVAVAGTQVASISAGRSAARTPKMILMNVRRDVIRGHLRDVGDHRVGADDDRPGPGARARVVPLSPDAWSHWDGEADTELPHGRRDPMAKAMTASVMAVASATEPNDLARTMVHGAVQGGALSPTDAELLWRVAVNDEAPVAVGAQLGMARATSYKARDRAARGMRSYLARAS